MAWSMNDGVDDTYNLLHSTGAESIFALKELLKSVGWTVLMSGDGLLVYDAVGDSITAAGAGANGMNNVSAWFRITDPDSARELLFQRGANSYAWILQYSRLEKFDGGAPSATVLPTATDMVGWRAGSSVSGTLFPTAGSWYCQIAAQDAAEGDVYAFWLVSRPTAAGASRMAMFCEALDNALAPAADSDQSIWYAQYATTATSVALLGNNAGMASALAASKNAYCWQRYGEADQSWGVAICFNCAYFTAAGGFVALYPAAVAAVNPETSCYPLLSGFWAVLNGTATGYKGWGKYLRINPRNDVCVYTDLVQDSLTTADYMVYADLLFPGWPDTGTMPSA
jgi:hypothetical protein